MTGRQFATILTITFIVGIIWLVADILFNIKPGVPVNPKLDVLLQPINPNFNPRVLEIIRDEVADTPSVPASITNTATPNSSSTGSPVPSASPIQIPIQPVRGLSEQPLL